MSCCQATPTHGNHASNSIAPSPATSSSYTFVSLLEVCLINKQILLCQRHPSLFVQVISMCMTQILCALASVHYPQCLWSGTVCLMSKNVNCGLKASTLSWQGTYSVHWSFLNTSGGRSIAPGPLRCNLCKAFDHNLPLAEVLLPQTP